MKYILAWMLLFTSASYADEWEFEFVQPKEPVEHSYYVVMFSASWCGPCKSYKQSGKLDKITNGGIKVVVVDTDTNTTYYKGSVPRFWICRNKIRVHEFAVGAIEPEKILKKIEELNKPKAPTNPNVYNGKPNNSHTNRQSLINHLISEGIHKGKYSISHLNSLSDTDLDNLHSLDHNTK